MLSWRRFFRRFDNYRIDVAREEWIQEVCGFIYFSFFGEFAALRAWQVGEFASVLAATRALGGFTEGLEVGR